ncbi:MAG: hypothetical protein IPO60_09830 [Flavobacteriales bacterium]|nr:hypothetical protein [Flavobacteriales bacterium]MBK7247294.1 hypothetical protein [Flavobacteriales bacterium]MBK9598590.1 hypothetical protein [Flavobacteriales bacterium]HQY04147.1 hypothetical protein [Flavobacteriales bacterium]
MDWREYIQRPTVYAPPIADMSEVVQWMRERPGTTEPGQYPTASAEHAEAEAKLQSIRERQRVYDARHYAKRTLTTAAQ